MDEYNRARQLTIDLVSELQRQTHVPLPPSELMKPPLEVSDPSRRLTFEQETQIADDFAFLAYTKDDTKYVKAVAIEEEAGGINIRVATNTGIAKVDELQELAGMMMLATSRATSRQPLRSRAFSCVVKMCYARILQRLRSKHAIVTMKTGNRPALPALLWDTINKCTIDGSQQVEVCKSSQRLLNCFQHFESTQDFVTLEQMLLMASEFDCSTLSIILTTSTEKNLEIAIYLLQAITKLGRYHNAAVRLLNAAANLHFHHITVLALQPYEVSSLDSSHQLPRKAHYPAGKSRVHAEIQLLLCYELQSKQPRVICASKRACYLCHLFFSIHGKFATPASHGRLYEKWTLPDWTKRSKDCLINITPILIRCNASLRETIKKKKCLHYQDPTESSFQLHTQWPSQSTLVDVQVLIAARAGLEISGITSPLLLNGVEVFFEVSSSWCGSRITLDVGRIADSLDVEAMKIGDETRLEILQYPARLDIRAQGRCFGLILDR